MTPRINLTGIPAGQHLCGAPAGIEPATPSLPWNHREPLCDPPFPQLTPDRRGRSYRFSFDEVIRSLCSRLALMVATSRSNSDRIRAMDQRRRHRSSPWR